MIMIWFVVLVIVLWIILGRACLGPGYSVIKIFNYFWLFNVLVYALKLYAYYILDERVYLYIVLFVTTVNIVFLIRMRGYRAIYEMETENIQSAFHISKSSIKIVAFLSLLSWMISFNRIRRALTLISQVGMVGMRTLAYDETTYTTIEKLCYQYFVQPLFVISIILAVSLIVVCRGKQSRYLILVAIVNALVYSVLFGGRSLLVLIAMYFFILLCLLCGTRISALIKRHKKMLVLFMAFLIPILFYASMRVTRSWGIIGEIGVYLTGGLGYLSECIKHSSFDYGILWGRGLFGFIYDAIGLGIKILGGNVKLVSQYYSDYTNGILLIGDSIRTNFTATAMGTLLLDFGEIGLVVGGIWYGMIFSYAERKYNNTNTLYSLLLYLYVSNIAIESIQNYTFKSVVVLFVLIYMKLLFDNRIIRKGRLLYENSNKECFYSDY